jgi:hypothetical protein
MKSLFSYYFFAIILPVSIFYLFIKLDQSKLFVIFLLFYAIIYRPFIDGYKLLRKKKITKKELWKLVIGYGHIKWFKDLYLKK